MQVKPQKKPMPSGMDYSEVGTANAQEANYTAE
jgi:hypothetical protein